MNYIRRIIRLLVGNVFIIFHFCLAGEFILTKPNIQMKSSFNQYSVNESHSSSWDPRIKAFIEKKKNDDDKPTTQR